MVERSRRNLRRREFVRQAEGAGQEVILKGFQFAITTPRGQVPTQDNVKFIWVRRPVESRKLPDRGLTKNQLRVIRLFEAIGLGKMVARL